ncbi:MAG TPA: YdeI/OmpD-associated family protein [Verrucomicrobiae bacterium]
MAKKDPRVDAYIEKAAEFAKPVLRHLRQLVHEADPDIEETLKWSMPSFMHRGIVCVMAAFKAHCTFGFWKHKLVFGKGAGSRREGEAMGQFGRIASVTDLPKDSVIIAAVRKAVRLNEAGVKTDIPRRSRERKELPVPEILTAALRGNEKARRTFEQFSYSHRKEYIEWIVEAKREETRLKRVATALAWLAQGKPRNWKYLNC